MGDIIFNILWWALAIWTGLVPNGYAPYFMLGFNAGDLMATLYFGVGQGYLKEEGDFDLGAFLLSTLGFIFLGGFYIGGLSFKPGSDPYNNAVYFVFATFLLTFLYRYMQYTLGRFIK